jgi:PAS domain S-box-containing protein
MNGDDARLREEIDRLHLSLQELRARLEEPEEIIRAIRSGEVDAFVVNAPRGEQIFSLRSADRLYRAMVEQMKEGAVALDASGLIIFCNWHFAHLMRAKRESLVGTSIFSFVPAESLSFFQLLQQQAGEVSSRRELSFRASDGSPVPAFAAMNRMQVEDQEVFCLMLTDLTERRFREELLAESQRKDEFLAMLAHELRNPIAPILNAAQIIRLKAPADPGLQWARDVIERQVGQLSRLVDDLLDVSRISRGKVGLQREPLDLAAAVNRGIETSRPFIDARRHQLAVQLPAEPVPVLADAGRIAQVVANLLNNAAKFTPEGGQIWVTLQTQDRTAQIQVRDNGVGIAAETLPRIFDLFIQADSSPERAQGGLGIGLTLVRRLVQMHGGTVEARSAGPGQGAELVVRLPLAPEGWQPPAPAPVPEPAAEGESRRVLIVDDNEDAGSTLGELLQCRGYQVRTVTTGERALGEALAFAPEVMLIDIGLPEMDGYEVARRLRSIQGQRCPVLVALTGYGQAEDRRRSLEAGFDEHLTKPVAAERLFRVLATVAARRDPAPD